MDERKEAAVGQTIQPEDISATSILSFLDSSIPLRSCHEIGHELSGVLQTLETAGLEADAVQIDRERRVCLLTVRATIINARKDPDEAERERFTGIVGFSDGSVFPDPDKFSDEDIAYFRDRTAVSENPVLKARYSDFLFEKGRFSREDRSQKYQLGLAAVDAYLGSAQNFADTGRLRYQVEMVAAMDQAAYLALHLQNRDKIAAVVEKLEALLNQQLSPPADPSSVQPEQEPSPVGRWSLELARILLHIRASKKFGNLVEDVSVERLRDLMDNVASQNAAVGLLHLQGYFLDVAAKAADLLGDASGVYVLQVRDAEALVHQGDSATRETPPRFLMAANFYEDAVLQYSRIRQTQILTPEQRSELEHREAALKRQIREAYRCGRDEMKVFTTFLDIPKDELTQMLDEILVAPELSDCLNTVATEGALLPNLELAQDEATERLQESSLLSIIPRRTLRDDMAISEARTDEQRLADEMNRDLLLWIGINSDVVLTALFARLRQQKGLTAEALWEYLAATDLFDADNLEIIRVGLERYFANDYVSSLHILVPQFEDAIRTLFERSGEGVIRPRPSSTSDRAGWEFETFGSFLSREGVRAAMPDQMREYIKIVMIEPTGWNLRNRVAHGLIRPQDCTEAVSVTVLHLFLLLTLFRQETGTDDSQSMGAPTAAATDPTEQRIGAVGGLI